MEKELNEELKWLEIIEMKEKAEKAVVVAAGIAAGTGAIPIPFADVPLLIAEQVALMAKICRIYGFDVADDVLRVLAATVLSAGGGAIVGKTIATNLLKLVPGGGTIAGGAISAGTAGLVTLAMGKAFIEVCNMVKLGKMNESDIASAEGKLLMKKHFKDQLKKNKK